MDKYYRDIVGGLHGTGTAPDGTECGECVKTSCEDCEVWLHPEKYVEK